MLITKEIKVKFNKRYSDIGYVGVMGGKILISVHDLPRGSRSIVSVKCDFCDSVRDITFKNYNTNISRGNMYACSIKCGSMKAKINNLEKYGVDSTNKLESVKRKVRETVLDKYGVDHISNIEEVRESKRSKMLEQSEKVSDRMCKFWTGLGRDDITRINNKRVLTNLERYGVDNVSSLYDVKRKKYETFNNRWGGVFLQSNIIRDKIFNTNLERYGCVNPMSNDVVRNKMSNTNLERYGVENIMHLPSTVDYIKSLFFEKYGVESYFDTDEFKNSDKYNPMSSDIFRTNTDISKYPGYIRYLGKFNSEFRCDNGKEHNYEIDSINFHNRKKLSIPICTTCNPISSQNSISECEVFDFVDSIYDGELISNYRDRYEIDIYIPSLSIGIEFNGLYWHSDIYKGKDYHNTKSKYFGDRGIRIINIWEDDWNEKSDIIKSQIRHVLNLTKKRVFARKCTIREIVDNTHVLFLKENHLQGHVASSVKIGLYHYDVLVSVMTFDQSEGRSKMSVGEWNLSRFCNIKGMSIVGGSSKLLKYFERKFQPTRIISYADKDWSVGSLYNILGFSLVKELPPDYKYILGGVRVNKQRFTLDRLNGVGTEKEITESMNIPRIYNVGKLKYERLY